MKSSEETKNKICTLISEGETISCAVKSVGITRPTFYSWRKKDKSFADDIKKAEQAFIDNCPWELKIKAKDAVRKAIEIGKIAEGQEDTELVTIFEKPIYEGDQIIKYVVTRRETQKVTRRNNTNFGVPEWAIDRVLPKPIGNLEEAVKVLDQHGLRPIIKDEHIFTEWLKSKVSSEDASGKREFNEIEANDIRAQILGIEEDPINTTAVSTELGQG